MAIRKSRSRFDLLVFLFIIAITLGSYSSYSKYSSSASGSSNVNIAAWNVKVNSEDITNSTTLSEKINFKTISNEYVAPNKLAPSSEGYFDIVLDTTSAEVAAHYTISIDLSSTSTLGSVSLIGYDDTITDFSIESTSVPNEENLREINDNKIEGDILLDTNTNKGQVKNFRVYLSWNDDENLNETQTVAGSSTTDVEIPITILVEQYYK